MRQADMPFTALDRIGVTTGPGSFTDCGSASAAARGIRASIPPAKAGRFGVTTLAAFAGPPHVAADNTASVTVAIRIARHQTRLQCRLFGPRRAAPSSAAAHASAEDAAPAAGPDRTAQPGSPGTGAALPSPAAWPPARTRRPVLSRTSCARAPTSSGVRAARHRGPMRQCGAPRPKYALILPRYPRMRKHAGRGARPAAPIDAQYARTAVLRAANPCLVGGDLRRRQPPAIAALHGRVISRRGWSEVEDRAAAA